jgi:hypothetical protein
LSCCRPQCTGRDGSKVADQAAEPVQPQPNVGASRADHYPLHQRPHNPCLLCREQVLPQRIKPMQGVLRFALSPRRGTGDLTCRPSPRIPQRASRDRSRGRERRAEGASIRGTDGPPCHRPDPARGHKRAGRRRRRPPVRPDLRVLFITGYAETPWSATDSWSRGCKSSPRRSQWMLWLGGSRTCSHGRRAVDLRRNRRCPEAQPKVRSPPFSAVSSAF